MCELQLSRILCVYCVIQSKNEKHETIQIVVTFQSE